MPTPRVLILRAPGTNCDQETAFAFQQCGAEAELLHVNRVLESPAQLDNFQILCLPGGFSYGDDIAAGRILGNQFRHHLAESIGAFKEAGKLVLGICNGFQILLKAGMLLDETPAGPDATLTWNDSGKFEDRWVELHIAGQKCVFLKGLTSLYLPVAHAEGKIVFRDAATQQRLEQDQQLAVRYTGPNGVAYPWNPNGSVANVAGMCDETGRVFGLMPHPERNVDVTHHPRWTRGEASAVPDGLAIFNNAVDYFN